MLGDDPVQARIAEEVLGEPVWIPLTVMLELGWMLDKPLGLPRATVAAILRQVLNLETAAVERSEHLYWALDRYLAGGDWADMIHLAAVAGNADSFATFDGGIARKAGRKAPLPVETLGRR